MLAVSFLSASVGSGLVPTPRSVLSPQSSVLSPHSASVEQGPITSPSTREAEGPPRGPTATEGLSWERPRLIPSSLLFRELMHASGLVSYRLSPAASQKDPVQGTQCVK